MSTESAAREAATRESAARESAAREADAESREAPRAGFGLAKCERLGGADEFDRVFARRASAADGRIVVHVAEGQQSWSRIGIRIGRKYGSSPARNRFKRLVREAFRQQKHRLPSGLDVVVTPRSPKPETPPGRKKPKNAPRPKAAKIVLADVAGPLADLVRRAVRGLRPSRPSAAAPPSSPEPTPKAGAPE